MVRKRNRIRPHLLAGVIATGILCSSVEAADIKRPRVFQRNDGSGGITDLPRVPVNTIRWVDTGGPIYTGIQVPRYNSRAPDRGGSARPAQSAKEQQTQDEQDASICPEGGSQQETSGNPVVLATGNKVEPELDFASEGEMGLYLQRTYNHHWSATGLFGGHWLSNFDYSLVVDSANVAWLQRPDGRRLKFTYDANTQRWHDGKPASLAYLVKNGDGTYTLHNESRGVEHYNAEGYITRLTNEHGVAWDFAYTGRYLQSVTHTSGRRIGFTWANGVVSQVTDPAGNAYAYTYTPNAFGAGRARLASTRLPGAPETTLSYHYEDSRFKGGLTGKSINGVRYSTFAYDANGRAALSEHAGGVDRYTFSYTVEAEAAVQRPPAPPPPGGYLDDAERGWCEFNKGTRICFQPRSGASATVPTRLKVTEVNPLGRRTTHTYENGKKIAVAGEAAPHCPASYKELSYDANGFENIVSDFEDRLTDFDYDAHGHLLRRVDGAGSAVARVTTYEWHEGTKRLVRETAEGRLDVQYTYTPEGRIESKAETDLASGQSRTTRYAYSYHPNGLLAAVSVDGPLPNDTVVSTFDTNGDLLSTRDPQNHVTLYRDHTALGQPRRIIAPDGAVTELDYDARGRVVATREYIGGAAQVTAYAYDGAGRLANTRAPDGVVTHHAYDAAGRLMRTWRSRADRDYAQRRYTYNAASQPTVAEVERAGHVEGPATVPAAPSLSAPGINASGSYTVQWSQVGGALSYHLEEAAGGAAWSAVYSGSGVSSALTGRNTTHAHAYRVRACNFEGCGGYSNTVTVQPSVDAADFVGQTVPTVMVAGQTYPVTVQLRNTGTLPWTAGAGYRLGSQNPGDTMRWGVHRVAPTGDVAPGAVGTFTFNVIAPADGTHAFQWRMVRDGHGWFGATTPNVAVATYSGSISASPNPCTIPAGASTCTSTVTWGTAPGGAEVWVSNLDGSASQLFDGTNTGSAKATWIPASGKRFTLRKHGLALTSVDVFGQPEPRIAEFVSQAVPRAVRAGDTFPASVTFKNAGRLLWSAGYGYGIGSQSPHDNVHWGTNRVPVPGVVTTGQHATFDFTARAPTTPGTYGFQWRMVQDGVTWFGPTSPKVDVVVASGSISASANPCRIYTEGGTCASTISWNSSHSGAEVWVTNLDGSYPQLFMPNTRSGSASAPWITTAGKRFHLKYGDLTLATVDVSGYVQPLPPLPDPDAPKPCTRPGLCEQPRSEPIDGQPQL